MLAITGLLINIYFRAFCLVNPEKVVLSNLKKLVKLALQLHFTFEGVMAWPSFTANIYTLTQ